MESKRYEIDSFNKLINVANKENVQRLSIDLAGWLMYIVDVMDKLKEIHPELKDKPNSEIVEASFVWIDDYKHEMNGIKIINNETGEVNFINSETK